MPSSIPRTRTNAHANVKTTSLRALMVAARLERGHADDARRGHAEEGPPGHANGRAEWSPERRTPDPA
ncbi:hypothetical protein E1200_18685 [Actinomadura sp. GC306]|uniref:hypothetical protein n=1 Tax=Actinomadura sp. GC306 TaxID=2530367 RepID=UPI00104FB25F|nr:hypothetical protein [Actinomadura sp. GC306]TDC65300.1 hypothetical protein E1200_18685 [Actinomadura sp. GC306]